jgi:hypothetical protein
VLLSASIESEGISLPTMVRNFCEEGALVCADELPAAGAQVIFRRNGLDIESRVAWVHANHAGIAFSRRLASDEVLQHVSKGQRKVQARHQASRPGFSCRSLTAAEKKGYGQPARNLGD